MELGHQKPNPDNLQESFEVKSTNQLKQDSLQSHNNFGQKLIRANHVTTGQTLKKPVEKHVGSSKNHVFFHKTFRLSLTRYPDLVNNRVRP